MRLAWILCAVQVASAAGPIQLSLKRAVEVAVSPEGNTRIQLSGEALKQAQSRSAQARAALLPDLEASLTDRDQTANLAAMGITYQPCPFRAFSSPRSSARSPPWTRALRLPRACSTSARSDASRRPRWGFRRPARTSTAPKSRWRRRWRAPTWRRSARMPTWKRAQSDVTLAEAVLKQAENQKAAGTGTGIEITRAKVQLANDRQRLLVAGNQRTSARLQLLRVMGLRLDTELELTDKLAYVPVDAVTMEQAKAQALKERPDLKAQQEREANARMAASATKMERLPSVAAFGDYGSIGTGFDNALPTRTYGISLRVPVFDGGRRDARRAESASQYRSEKVRTNDLKEQIELDVRLALDGLESAEQQVKVAKEGLELAENELAQARRRVRRGSGHRRGSDRRADAAGTRAR